MSRCHLLALLLAIAVAAGFQQPAAAAPPGPPGATVQAPVVGAPPGEREVPRIRVTPEMTRYSYTRYALYFVGVAWELAALWVLLRSGASARLRDLAERRVRNGLLRAGIYWSLLALAQAVLLLPLSFYAGYLLPHQYGLSTQGIGGWALDRATLLAVTAAIGAPVVALLFWMIQRSPRRWWFGFWVALIPLLTVAIWLAPLVIDPLFNRFRPLPDAALRTKILALAQRAGIARSRVFEMDASRRTRKTNAYVTGIGGSARIVLWDTLLEQMDEEETLAVVGHEIGHYVEGHVPIGLALAIAGSLFILWATDRAARFLVARWGRQWGLRGLDDLAALPALLLALSLLQFLGTPAEAAISRTMERRADSFALQLTDDGRAAAAAFVRLAEGNLSHPDPPPFIEYWMFTHPPLQDRVERALRWNGQQ